MPIQSGKALFNMHMCLEKKKKKKTCRKHSIVLITTLVLGQQDYR